MTEGNNSPRINPDHSNSSIVSQIKRAQTFVTIATIAAPVSLLFGGVLLSSVALAFGLVGINRLRKISTTNPHMAEQLKVAFKSTKMTVIMCCIALGLNAISLAIMYPSYLEFIQTGEFSGLMDPSAIGSQSPQPNSPSSVWG